MTVGAMILAAGFSRRFGSHKLLAALSSGETVLAQTLSRIRGAVPHLLIITRPQLAAVLKQAAAGALEQAAAGALERAAAGALEQAAGGANILTFDEAEQGMGATLAFAAANLPDWDAALVCLADMPFISGDTYAAVAAKAAPDRIVVPEYRGRPGNPVAFGSRFFPALTRLGGDGGARPLLRQNPEAVLPLPLDDRGILLDVDTPDDLHQ